jgi:hypothetical protein
MAGGGVTDVENVCAGQTVEIRDFDVPSDWVEGVEIDEWGNRYQCLKFTE